MIHDMFKTPVNPKPFSVKLRKKVQDFFTYCLKQQLSTNFQSGVTWRFKNL